MASISDEKSLIAVATALGAESVKGLSTEERGLLANLPDIPAATVAAVRQRIDNGADPLGDAFCTIRSAKERRVTGAIFTPPKIIKTMLDWAEMAGQPSRVVEPGAGAAPFLLEAARRFPNAHLVAVENDPVAALIARGNLAAAGLASRSEVRLEDFRRTHIEEIEGRTLYIGNPPYVRHHLIDKKWKEWLKNIAGHFDLRASTLAGLHVYFFLAIARWAKSGDYGSLITAAEWLDVNYGKLVRELFLGRLGGESVIVIEPNAEPFPGTLATGAITTFTVAGSPQYARFTRVEKLADLTDLTDLTRGRKVRRERLATESRWSHFTRKSRAVPHGYVELGELCRVHRGQVTGANRIWIAGAQGHELPEQFLVPTVTKALELFDAGASLTDLNSLKRVVDLPVDLSGFTGANLEAIEAFLAWAELMGARDSSVAQNRRAWWSVGLRKPAPILATYMARRPPTFVLNPNAARHINIAHGLYPRESLDTNLLEALTIHLRESSTTEGGRVYSGGLTKFEPREMERIPVPEPKMLAEMVQ